MTRIDPGAAARLRAQSAAPASRSTVASRPAAQPGVAPRHLAAAALARIRSIPADDPDRPRKALRLYLEATLQQAFGPQLALDGSFETLLHAVIERMDADPQIAAVAQRAGRVLCDRSDSA